MKKWLKKGSAVLLAVTMVLTLFPGMQQTVQAADKVEKKYWTDVAGLKEFNLSSSTAIGKIKFGLDNENSRIWAICGTDGDNLAMLSTTAFATGAYGTSSKYSESNFVKDIEKYISPANNTSTYLSTTYFSDKELEKMADVTVSTNEPDGNGGNTDGTKVTKKLYLPNSYDQDSFGSTVTTIYVGSGNNIEIDVKKLTSTNGFQQTPFWLRSPCNGGVSTALVAGPASRVSFDAVDISLFVAAVPAFNLNLSSVIFASAANAALAEGNLTGTENTYTLRYASTTGENGIISSDGGSVRVKDAEGKFLVAQNKNGACAKKINGNDETITVDQMGTQITNFNNCEVWIESTDADRITTATRIVDKVSVPLLTVNSITKTYDGKPVADSEITGTATVDEENISGKWNFAAGQQLTNVKDSGEKVVIFTPTDTDMYGEAQGKLQLTIKKAQPTGSPKFTKITEAGKTLADAALDKTATTPGNGFNVPGTVEWDDDDNTVVEADKAYSWTFTPNDENNYETVKDNVIVYATGGGGGSSSGGGGTGGGGGSSSGTVATPETKIDPADAQSNLFGMASTIDVTGKERSETSMQLADQTKKALGVEKFSTIILASGTDFPDGLGVSALSIQQKAPVLIVTPGTEAAIKKYIEENLVYDGRVIISGGTGAVSQSMQNSLNGIEVSRLGGADRYKTNILTIKELLAKGAGKDEVLIASGKDFADALSASATGKIIMIVGDNLTGEQKALLKETGFGKITILGGTGAVSGSIENELNAVTGKKADRVGGANRIETSKLIAARYFPGSTTSVYTKANGFADGLAGGLLANITGSPMRLSYGAGDMTAGGKAVTLGGVK